MCIIVYKPKGRTVKKDTYQACFDNNSDGAGFIVREKTGELKLEKGFFTFKDFWEHFQPHQSKQAIVHFRIRTHGDTDKENCHPYWVKEGKLAFAHNGIISNIDFEKDKTKSDTWHFNVKMLQHLQEKLGEEFIWDPILQELISNYIGYSKLTFMHQDGRVLIFGKATGTKENGVWFSNYSFHSYKQKKEKFDYARWNKEREEREAKEKKKAANDNRYLGGFPKPPVVARLAPPMSSTLKINDYIEMIQPYKDLTGAEVGLVMAVYADRTAEIKVYDARVPTGWKIRCLPYEVFKIYTTAEQNTRDYEKESAFLKLEDKSNIIEGQVLSCENSTDMSQVTKLEERKETLEEAACNELFDYHENYLH